jgi:outer membrane protein assembly factor BamB
MKILRNTLLAGTLLAVSAQAADWPVWGRNASRNMASDEKGAPTEWDIGQMDENEVVDMSSTRDIKWVAKIGSQAYGNVTVGNGKVLIGTNNESPRDPKKKGDRGVVYCFNEKTGAYEWQLIIPKLGAGKVSDWEYIGICSSPAIVGDKVYLVTNRCETVCLDLNGLSNGNDGPYKDEAKYMTVKGEDTAVVEKTDADILWVYDMRDELGIFPHNVTSSSPIVIDGIVYNATSNGVDWSHTNIPSPLSPNFIGLDAKTGELLGEEGSGASARCLHASWSSLTYGEIKGQKQLIWGASDGYCYGFDPKVKEDDEGFKIYPELWRVECNEPEYRKDKDGKKIPYATPPGPSECIGTPVLYKDKVYVAIGQDPEHGDGVGRLTCIDPTQRGDISKTGVVWKYTGIGRTISTVSIADDLVYAAEYAGQIHCLDAKTGKVYWVHDTLSRIWGSTLVVDGKVYIGTEDGEVIIFEAGKEKKILNTIDMGAPVYSSPVYSNGTLYIATQTHLYAIGKKES